MPQSLLRFPLNSIFSIGTNTRTEAKGLNSEKQSALETPFFAVKQKNTLYVYRNHCPHLGLPLEWMPDQFLDADNCYIQCATHGALFNIHDGLCVSGPCKGENLEAIPFTLVDSDTQTRDELVINIDQSYLTSNPR